MYHGNRITFLALVIGVRIASTMTISSGLSRDPTKAPAEAERCEPIISIRRAASMALACVFDVSTAGNNRAKATNKKAMSIFRGMCRLSSKKCNEALFRAETSSRDDEDGGSSVESPVSECCGTQQRLL